MPNDRYFPIISDTSCRSKWSWSTIYLNTGHTGSCHRSSMSVIADDFDNFHNTDKKIQARQLMLEGKWPGDGCEYCKDIESADGYSDRQFQNQIPNVYPSELDNDSTLTTVNPVILEVFFSNACNLKCIYCNASYSSSIQSEDKKFGGAILSQNNFNYDDNRYRELNPKFWNWFKKHSTSLQRLQILGGEPFIQTDLNELIEYVDTMPHPALEFNLVTNLSLPYKSIHSHLTTLAKFVVNGNLKRVDIQASVDCWGPAQEYIRNGFDCTMFEHNMKELIKFGQFRIGLLSTITSLSIPTMSNLVTKFNEWNQLQTIFWYMHLVLPINDSIFSPTIFNFSKFESHLNQIAELLPNTTWDDKTSRDTFLGIVNKLEKNCREDTIKQHQLLLYLNENDQRRGTNWKKTFPWLEKELEHVV